MKGHIRRVFSFTLTLVIAVTMMPVTSYVATAETYKAGNGKTIVIAEDNENNAHTGEADNDIDSYLSRSNDEHPIEVSFWLDELPEESLVLAIKAFDVDEDEPVAKQFLSNKTRGGELDFVYINDDIFLPMEEYQYPDLEVKPDSKDLYNSQTVGYLGGTNNTWNTTLIEVPLHKLKIGKNVVSITISQHWSVEIDWIQVLIDGGDGRGVDSFSIELGNTVTNGDYVDVEAEIDIQQSGNSKFITEYTIVNKGTGNAVAAGFGKASSHESLTLKMPLDSPSGEYELVGIIKMDDETEQILATDSTSFNFYKGMGFKPIPCVSHTLSTVNLTKNDVVITLNIDDDSSALGCSNVQVSFKGGEYQSVMTGSTVQGTASVNGFYTYKIKYDFEGDTLEYDYKVTISNIDKLAPIISFGEVSVLEDIDGESVKAALEAALKATDENGIVKPPTVASPDKSGLEAYATMPGIYTFSATASDTAGNEARENFTFEVEARPLSIDGEGVEQIAEQADFRLRAIITYPGTDVITETGYVWGIMSSPTVTINNGKAASASPADSKGETFSVIAEGLEEGILYYGRPYAKAGDNYYYGEQITFGSNIPNYGTFKVTNSGNTFTISRDGDAGEQTVYYRTVNGSAVGSTHFEHAADVLTFGEGEVSKTVAITEYGVNAQYGDVKATAYSNANRTYELEIYRVDGGAQIDYSNNKATRTMTGNTTIDKSIFTSWEQTGPLTASDYYSGANGESTNEVSIHGARQYCDFDSIFDINIHKSKINSYLEETITNYAFRFKANFWENNDCYQMLRFIAYDSGSELARQTLQFEMDPGDSDKTTRNLNIPSDSNVGAVENFTYTLEKTINGQGSANGFGGVVANGDEDYYLVSKNTTKIVVGGHAQGSGTNDWRMKDIYYYSHPYDSVEPAILAVAPMAGGIYKPGDEITISLIFNEIVDSEESSLSSASTIETSWGTFAYAGGADTNILYFKGVVPANAGSTISLMNFSCAGSVKDLCSVNNGTATASENLSAAVTVDTVVPTVSITDTGVVNGLATAKVLAENSDTLKYAWSEGTVMPLSWFNSQDAEQATTEMRRSSGKMYLHALASRDANGAMAHTYKEYDFTVISNSNPEIVPPELTLTVDNTNWAISRDINIEKAPANATVTYSKAGGSSEIVSGDTVTVTENGTYIFVVNSNGEAIAQNVRVEKIDSTAPTAVLRKIGNVGSIYSKLIFTATAEDDESGIEKLLYSWSTSAQTPSDGVWETAEAVDGKYIMTYVATESVKTQRYLHVKVYDKVGNVTNMRSESAYTFIKAAEESAKPMITLSGNPEEWVKSATLLWNVTNEGAGGYIVNANNVQTASPSGLFSVNENGIYIVSIKDRNEETGVASVKVSFIDNEAPTVSEIEVEEGWLKSKLVTITGATDAYSNVTDERGNIIGASGSGIKAMEWKLGDGEWNIFVNNSFNVTVNGSYEVKITDNVGNYTIYHVIVSGIDRTAPDVTAPAINSEWKTDDFEYTIDFTDLPSPETTEYSGIKTAQYAVVSSKDTTPSALTDLPDSRKVIVSDDGCWYIYYKLVDYAGNVIDGFSDIINLDKTKPVISDITVPENWTKDDDKVSFKVSDSTSGICSYKVVRAEDGEEFTTVYDETNQVISITADLSGSYIITAVDNAGNTQTETVLVDRIDKTNPVVSITPAISEDVWYGETCFTIRAEDERSGISTVHLSGGAINNLDITSSGEIIGTGTYGSIYEGSVTVSEDTAKAYTYTVYAFDNAGNTIETSVTVKLDTRIDDFIASMQGISIDSTFEELAAVQSLYNSYTQLVKNHIMSNPTASALVNELSTCVTNKAALAIEEFTEKVSGAATIAEIRDVQNMYEVFNEDLKESIPADIVKLLEKKVSDAELAEIVEALIATASNNRASYDDKDVAVKGFEMLSDDQKNLIERSREEYEDIKLDLEAVNEVVAAVNLADKKPYSFGACAKITSAAALYNDLSASLRGIVPEATVNTLDRLKDMAEEAEAVEEVIDRLDDVYSTSDDERIIDAVNEYNSMSESEKTMLQPEKKAKLAALYQALLEDKSLAESKAIQAATDFIADVEAVNKAPTISEIKALIASYESLSASAAAIVTNNSAIINAYDNLKADYEAAIAVIEKLKAVTSENIDSIETSESLSEYNNLSDSQKALVDEHTDNIAEDISGARDTIELIKALVTFVSAHEAASPPAITVSAVGTEVADLEKCDHAGHTEAEHQASIEAAETSYEKLGDRARNLIPSELRQHLESEYDNLMSFLEYINTAHTSKAYVEISGMTNVQLPPDSESEEVVKTIVKVVMKDSETPFAPDGGNKHQIVSVDIKLMAEIYVSETDSGEGAVKVAEENVQPKDGHYVTVKLKIPNGYKTDTIVLWHIKDNGMRSMINDFRVVKEGAGKYVVFDIEEFSHFVLFADKEETKTRKKNNDLVEPGFASCPLDETCPVNGFADTSADKWYHDGVHYAVEEGLMQGVGNNQFKPFDATDRATIVTVLWRLEGAPKPETSGTFSDVPAGKWYSDAIEWAAANGIVLGYGDDKFGPADVVTRQQMAAIFYRYAEYKGLNTEADMSIAHYKDLDRIDKYAYNAINWAVDRELIQGTSTYYLAPKEDSNRAQVATIFMRYCGKF